MRKDIWKSGIMGLVVGDALGIPVQFLSRWQVRNRENGPVTGMEAGGSFSYPEGTWSDDSSLSLATLSSLKALDCVDLTDIAERFEDWLFKGAYTPFGHSFDVGGACRFAISNYAVNKNPKKCGKLGEHANGNGALMRILPICIWGYLKVKEGVLSDAKVVKAIHEVGAITHNHIRSQMCCGMYYFMVKAVLDGESERLIDLLQKGIDDGTVFYKKEYVHNSRSTEEVKRELYFLRRLADLESFSELPETEIRSSGYVLDSIEAAVWCLITTDSYKDCMLKCVNLGDDTDSVAAIAGGIAGLYYGYDDIPTEWIETIQKRDMIEKLLAD